jgi:hypothetical protein
LLRGYRAGSKRARIRARTCGELTSGASDREIRGGRGSVAGGELPLPTDPSAGPEAPGIAGGLHAPSRARASSPSRARARARYRLGLCVCWLWGLMASFVRKASSAASLLCGRGGTKTGTESIPLPQERSCLFMGPFTGQRFSGLHRWFPPYLQSGPYSLLCACVYANQSQPNFQIATVLPMTYENLSFQGFKIEFWINKRTGSAFYPTICSSSAYF